MKIAKNFFIFIFSCIFVVFYFQFRSYADYGSFYGFDFDVKSEAVYLVNEDTGKLIYSKNEDKKIPAGAIVKLMTVILILDSVEPNSLDDFLNLKVRANGEIFDRLYGKSASNADIQKGEEVTVKDLLYASIMASACEATMMLVDFAIENSPQIFGNSVDEFVEKMQNKAKSIGLKNTKFIDPDGLDVSINQHTTAKDVYILTNYCMRNSLFKKIATTSIYRMAPTNKHSNSRNIIHSNYMTNVGVGGKRYFDKRVSGIKTGGYFDDKGNDFYNLVSMAKDETFTYVLVVLGAPKTREENSAFVDSNNFYNFVFKNLSCATLAVPFEKVIPSNVKVKLGKGTDNLLLTTKEQLVVIWPKNVDVSAAFFDTSDLPKELFAPIKKGQVIGKVHLKLAGQNIATVDAIAGQEIGLDLIAFLYVCVSKFFKYLWIFVVLILVLCLILWFITRNRLNNVKKIKRKIKFKKRAKKHPKFNDRWFFIRTL